MGDCILDKLVKDHLGNEYHSINEMCRSYKISSQCYRSRLKSGWSQEEALTGNHEFYGRSKKCKDHLGNEYKNIKQMCEAWGITVKAFEGRRRRMWTLEETLTNSREYVSPTAKPCVDHLGEHYPNILSMCKKWGVTKAAYSWRIKSGWTLEEALTGDKEFINPFSKKCRDHLGNEYVSISQMCKVWGISKGTYDYRIKCKWSKEKALTIDDFRKCKDHKGRVFPSVSAMCIYWEVTRSAYDKRLEHGWTQEEALTGGKVYVHNTAKTCVDHLGNDFQTIQDMLKAWNVSRSTFDSRIQNGWTLEESLSIPKNIRLESIAFRKY